MVKNSQNLYFIPTPTCHDFPRFVIIWEKSRPEVGNRWLLIKQKWSFLWKKTPYGQIFTNVFQNRTCGHGNTSSCEKLVKFGRPEIREIRRYLMDKKNSARAPAAASARIAPKICQGQPEQRTRSSPNFIQIRTRERRSNAPQSVCNTRRSFSFFAE